MIVNYEPFIKYDIITNFNNVLNRKINIIFLRYSMLCVLVTLWLQIYIVYIIFKYYARL